MCTVRIGKEKFLRKFENNNRKDVSDTNLLDLTMPQSILIHIISFNNQGKENYRATLTSLN